jgi:hypothetical protein
MGEYSEAFVAFDTAKTKHAVAIADAGRNGEVRFVGEVASSPARVERLVRKLAERHDKLRVSATRRGRPVMACTGRSASWDTPARWWRPR